MDRTVKVISKNFKKYNVESIDEYIKLGGFSALKKAFDLGPKGIINELKISDLKGRGGAAFPTGKKWEQATKVPGDRKIIICNADEGEPATFKDRYLLEYDPFKVIEGMTIAGITFNANEGFIYIREEYKYLHDKFKKAIQLTKENNYLGQNILNTGFNFDITVFSGAGAYVCGESTALIESIEGKSGRPRLKLARTSEKGLYDLPTLANNIETLAAVATILEIGGEEYAKYGTKNSKGTKLISLCGNINKPGAYEVPFGITLKEIIYDIGGGVKNGNALKFLQLGGASGPIVPASMIDLKYCYNELNANGINIGSGAILVADETNKVVDFLKSVQDFFLHESCGKCTPCREGNRQITKIINRFVNDEASIEDLKTIEKFANVMKYASFCGLGKTAPTALLSAIKHFPIEFYQHIKTVRKTS
ncbi:complex I 51 kDa subunit family protein [Paramaledivibacter caminithermalis]|jgi:NADH-quinone oxidoreductase subunit F|uniref:NADH-quinone oxidoreductase subunit F n=1 Tax=Paramaledivibacter caminithermalis (strain DSM 15212 / CIP 107654 / DViRD3) TaxID=1121301 RepID=A0A1M6R3Q3_PARC5|nr:NADH-ubiquinone oxidoreductase-F iron-sulfur binding region domain-containing protein [Paramaledivibacter caminithermalis]SHK27072.1 NADH-quinone oxidoreductase subunit F [Paramaledivibacter caminithermalis DSM 15212]